MSDVFTQRGDFLLRKIKDGHMNDWDKGYVFGTLTMAGLYIIWTIFQAIAT